MPGELQASRPQAAQNSSGKFATQAQSEDELQAQEQLHQVKTALLEPPPQIASPSSISPQVEPPQITSPSSISPQVEPPQIASPLSITPPVELGLVKLLQQQLEGLEHINIQPFVDVAHLLRTVDAEATWSQEYHIFQPVTEANLANIDDARRRFRTAFYPDTNLLIIKMLSFKHEKAHSSLGLELMLKVINMGISRRTLVSCGATRYPLSHRVSSKEGDSSYKPSSRRKDADWPTIVFEAGLSESLRHLRNNAKWWLRNSDGEVKIVILISIRPAKKELILEKWELAAPESERPATRAIQAGTRIPIRIQEIAISGSTITGAPLILGFPHIFLRAAIVPEGDITFSEQDLRDWADDFWDTD